MKIETILVPTDFSDDAQQAINTALDFAESFGSRIVLVHAYHLDLPLSTPMIGGPVILPEGFFVEYRTQAADQVEKLAKESARDGVQVRGLAIEGPAWNVILEQAKALPADLIVMGTRGLTGIKHVAMGSVAERVVRMSDCPVLTVKAS